MAEYRYRADGLIGDEGPLTAIKESSFALIGATWIQGDGIVWHMSKDAMDRRLRRYGCYELRVSRFEIKETTPISEIREFLELRLKFKDYNFLNATHERDKLVYLGG
jgi:hypothetical protein